MFYIQQAHCISPQQTYQQPDIETLYEPTDKKMKCREPVYEGIPPGLLRRMGTAVRIGVGAAMPIVKSTPVVDGIVIGTANGGMEDCIKFLNQIMDYKEGLLTPGNFVQSTSNAIAAQIGLMSENKGYNITHVHRGLSFENAMLDVSMQLLDNPGRQYLLGAADEISPYHYNIESLGGWYKNEDCKASQLFNSVTPGCIAGEGAAMFLVNNNSFNALAHVTAISTFHSEDVNLVTLRMKNFLDLHLPEDDTIDLILSGENGDIRMLHYYESCEALLNKDIPVVRFKHMTGEFATASGQALWLACYIFQHQIIPAHMLKKNIPFTSVRNILIYNNYKGYQHGWTLVSLATKTI